MLSRIKQARENIEVLRLALLGTAPEEIGAALPGLEDAARGLQAVEYEIQQGACAPYEVRRELKLLKNDLRISARLIGHGKAFCDGWSRMLGTGPAYTQAGQTAPLEQLAGSGGTLSLRG